MVNTMKADSMLGIMDFARITNERRSRILEWCKQGLILQSRRMPNGERFYSADQVLAVRLLQMMGDMELPPQRMVNWGEVMDTIQFCDEQLEAKIVRLREQQGKLRTHAALLSESRRAQPGEMAVRELPVQPLCSLPIEGDVAGGEPYGTNGGLWGYMYQRFYDLLERPDRPLRIVAYVPQGDGRRPDGTYLVATAEHWESDALPRRMLEFALQESLKLWGPAYTAYLPANGSSGERMMKIAVGVKHKEEGED